MEGCNNIIDMNLTRFRWEVHNISFLGVGDSDNVGLVTQSALEGFMSKEEVCFKKRKKQVIEVGEQDSEVKKPGEIVTKIGELQNKNLSITNRAR